MAGHSKWANIKHRKGAQDAKRGKIFTKLIREITVAAKLGGGDANSNPRLRTAIDKALAQNMTKDTIDRAIKRGVGGAEGDDYEQIRYEGYGPGGVAVMVDCLTDNKNRTVSEVRHAFTKMGGNLGTNGSVAYLFSKVGEIFIEPGANEDKLMEVAIEAGAEDVLQDSDGSFTVNTTEDNFNNCLDALKTNGFKVLDADLNMLAATNVDLDLDTAQTFVKMLDMLEDLDDVQKVSSNANISDEIAEKL